MSTKHGIVSNQVQELKDAWENLKTRLLLKRGLHPFSDEEITRYLADPVAFAIDEWGINPSPDQLAFLTDLADLNIVDMLIMAARGTGKSKALAIAAVWSMVFLPKIFGPYHVRVLAGSEDQARVTFDYIKDMLITGPRTRFLLSQRPIKIYAALTNGSTCLVYATSQREVRGPHPNLLIIDEYAEAERSGHVETLRAAKASVHSAVHGRRIYASTPHYVLGDFIQMWNNAESLGIRTYGPWTIEIGRRTWLSLEQQKLEWDRAIRDPFINFDVECLGRPGKSMGQVFDPRLIDEAVIDYPLSQKSRAEKAVGVDYGFIHPTVIVKLQLHGDKLYVLACEAYQQAGINELAERVKQVAGDDPVYPDASNPGFIDLLIARGCHIEEDGPVVFSREKESLISFLNHLLESKRISIHPSFTTLIHQLKAYRRDPKTGKPVKKDDDHVDALLCALKHFANPPPKPGAIAVDI